MKLTPTKRTLIKWSILTISILLALIALYYINHVVNQLRQTEEERVTLWAKTVVQKTELMKHTEAFFRHSSLDERRKIQMYTDILESFNNTDMNTDIAFSLAYVHYIVDSSNTPIVVTDKDSIITVPHILKGKKMRGRLLKEFSENEPFHYTLWGMPMTLYYKETQLYSDMRRIIFEVNNSIMQEISNNSTSMPVVITDSARTRVLASGNIDTTEINTTQKLRARIADMEGKNNPIPIALPYNRKAYIFFEDTPLLKMLRYIPVLYIFITMVLIVISYNLFRSIQNVQTHHMMVGMAKETAHQLGTPISSLMAWMEYLKGKTLDENYVEEINKDLYRLETISHRFSKIGSKPELEQEDICAVTRSAVAYLRNRTSKQTTYVIDIPDYPVVVPLSRTLYEWVIENLCKNAIDAMNGKGTITLRLINDNKNVLIEVGDTGRGIPSKQQKHIFDSGFTTKKRGWGLGLTLAKRIVNEYHRGTITLKESIEGVGTTFCIKLPKEQQQGQLLSKKLSTRERTNG